MIVSGGGLSADGTRWVAWQPGSFLPIHVLARLFGRGAGLSTDEDAAHVARRDMCWWVRDSVGLAGAAGGELLPSVDDVRGKPLQPSALCVPRSSWGWGNAMNRTIALMVLIGCIPGLSSCANSMNPEEYKAIVKSGSYSFFLKSENFVISKPYKTVSNDFIYNFEKCFNYVQEWKTPMMSARASVQVQAFIKRRDDNMTQVVVTERGNLNVGEGPPRILVEIQPEGKNTTRLQYYGAESWLEALKDWGHGPVKECPDA
jgi:hypothetical protein